MEKNERSEEALEKDILIQLTSDPCRPMSIVNRNSTLRARVGIQSLKLAQKHRCGLELFKRGFLAEV